MVFTVGVLTLMLLLVAGVALWLCDSTNPTLGATVTAVALLPLLLYSAIIFADSSRQNHSLWIGLLSIRAAFTQLMGYGFGFINAWWRRCVRGKDEFSAFNNTFYK